MSSRKNLWTGAAGVAALGTLAMFTVAGGQPSDRAGQTRARCTEAAREMGDLRREIEGKERILEKNQRAMQQATGTDPRLNMIMATVNDLADQRPLINQKLLAYNELLAGHILEHMAMPADQSRAAAQECEVYKRLAATTGRLEQADPPAETPPKK